MFHSTCHFLTGRDYTGSCDQHVFRGMSALSLVVAIAVTFAGCGGPPGSPPAMAGDKSPGAKVVDSKSKASAKPKTAGKKKSAVIEGRAYENTVALPGASIRGYESTAIFAKLGGYIETLGKVDEKVIDLGTRVEKETVLATLDVPEMANELAEKNAAVLQAESAVAQADAAIAEAEAEKLQREAELKQVEAGRKEKQAMKSLAEKKFARMSGLTSSGSIGMEVIDEARYAVDAAAAAVASVDADVAAAEKKIGAATAKIKRAEADKRAALAHVDHEKAALARTQTMMAYSTITAPFAGMITQRNVDHGAFVLPAERNSSAMPLFEVTRIDRVRVVVGVPNTKAGGIEPGMPARLSSIGGLPGRSFLGSVTRSAGVLDEKTRTMRIEVEFENPVIDERTQQPIMLKPGMFGTLTVIQNEWTEDDPVAVVPTSAIARDTKGVSYVVVNSGDQPERRDVSIVFNDAISVGIEGDVSVGETVLTNGLNEYQ